MCAVLYLCLVDEEDDVGDGVDGHIDAQLHRPAVTDPRPDTHKHRRSEVAQTLAEDKKLIHTHMKNTVGSLEKMV